MVLRSDHISFKQNTLCLEKYELLEQLDTLKDKPSSVLRKDV